MLLCFSHTHVTATEMIPYFPKFLDEDTSIHIDHNQSLPNNDNPFANAKIDTLAEKTPPKNTTGYQAVPAQTTDFILTDSVDYEYEVFGWYPHWFPDYYRDIDYSKISTISYFSYEFSPQTGKKISDHNWETTAMIDSAEANGCKILLTVSSFGGENNRIFLNNENAIQQMAQELLVTLQSRKEADGVCLDFENIRHSERDEFTKFVKELSSLFKTKGYEIYLALPSVDHNEAYDFAQLEPMIDKSVIMAYGYAGKWSDYPKPNAPIKSDGYSLTKTVDYYTGHLDSRSLLLAIPVYGMLWDVKEDSTTNFVGYRTLNYINSNINGIAVIDSLSKAAYISFNLKDNPAIKREVWFNNEVSLFYQIQLLKENELGGLGLWALGYEKDCPLFWEVIASELSQQPREKTLAEIEAEVGWWAGFRDYIDVVFDGAEETRQLILWMLMLIVGFGAIGFVISLVDHRTRDFFTTNRFIRMGFTALVLISAILVILVWDLEQTMKSDGSDRSDDVFMLIVGFLLGVASYVFITNRIKRKKNQLP